MELRRLSGRGTRPLRHVPFADQRARRHLAIGRVQGRPDPDAELVRAFAYLQPRGRSRRLEHQGHHRSAADRRLGARRRLRADGRGRPQQPAISYRRRHAGDGGLSEEHRRSRAADAPPSSAATEHREQPADQPRQDRLRRAIARAAMGRKAKASRRTGRRSPTTSRSRWSWRSIRSAWC